MNIWQAILETCLQWRPAFWFWFTWELSKTINLTKHTSEIQTNCRPGQDTVTYVGLSCVPCVGASGDCTSYDVFINIIHLRTTFDIRTTQSPIPIEHSIYLLDLPEHGLPMSHSQSSSALVRFPLCTTRGRALAIYISITSIAAGCSVQSWSNSTVSIAAIT